MPKIRSINYVWVDELDIKVDVSEFKSPSFGDAHMTLITQKQFIEEVGESAVRALSKIPANVLIALHG